MFFNETIFFAVNGVQCSLGEGCEFFDCDEIIYYVLVDGRTVDSSYEPFTISEAKKIAFDFIKGHTLNKTVGEFVNHPHIKGVR